MEPCGDVLTALLLSTTTAGHEENWSPSDSSDHPALINGPKRELKATRSGRSTQREQLQALRHEVSALSRHLQQLHENRQLQQSLDRLLNESTATGSSWKQVATRERHAKETAEEKKAEFMRRISINMSFLENVKHVLLTQAHAIADRPDLRLSMRRTPFVLHEDDAQLYQALKSSIDFRCSQLDAILQQCVYKIDTAESHESSIHADGRGLDVREHSVKPFDVTTISNTMSRHVEEQANFCWRGENDLVGCLVLSGSLCILTLMVLCIQYLKRTVTASELGEFSVDGKVRMPRNVRNRSVIRRVQHQGQIMMLVESITEWNNDHHKANEPEKTRLWQKGWMVLRPFEYLGDGGASLTQKGVSIQLQSSDRCESQILNPRVMSILESLRAFGKKQVQKVDNMLIDAAMQRQ